MMKIITTPLTSEVIKNLKVGDRVLLSGVVYTARDQAHKRLVEAIKKNKKLPLDLKSQVIYYCGPTNTPKGKVIGACGPTTSRRMDEFAPVLLKQGLAATIGKGNRLHKALYFLTYAGCGALIAGYVKSKKAVAYKELGPEAIYALRVERLPLIVAIYALGRNIYK